MDLSTTYMGFDLRSPLVPSASPLSRDLDNIKRMEDAGAAAVVLFSLFEEQITHDALTLDHYLNADAESHAEATSYFAELAEYNRGPELYLEHVRAAKAAVDIPIIASLNGVTPGGWLDYAKGLAEAGADGIELNIYFIPTDPTLTGSTLEQRYVDIVRGVKEVVDLPVAVKLNPFFTNLTNVALRLVEAGADALVLFNRFYQPDVDLEHLDVVPNLVLSSSASNRLPMRWIAILDDRVHADLAATTGVHSATDVLKLTMVGADVTMMTAALLQHGINHLRDVEAGVRRWLEEHEYDSLRQMRGSMNHRHCDDPSAFERGNYMRALRTFDASGRRL